jgi:PAS domain-containing protein
MGWRDLLQQKGETLVSPWLGGRSLRSGARHWPIEGVLPREYGWVEFALEGRRARVLGPTGAQDKVLGGLVRGYLVGDRLVRGDARVDPDPKTIADHSERVHLIDLGLDRFVVVAAGRVSEDSPLVFIRQEMPLGPESEVLDAFLDGQTSVVGIKGVSPALDAAFRMEVWQRVEAERRRRELEERLRLEEEVRQREARRQELVEKLGDGAARREMAQHDFGAAARAALVVGGAEYLEHRPSTNRGEMVVRFRIAGRRYECTCHYRTLQIIESGICLTDHDTGVRGDTWFTLESLPGVIRQADREGKLVVFRRVG